ncbi:TetR/AcrR family transcriptional regulator [Marinactinospora rubrisoli]|uniref:TetR/AcrR family transcriptional regulator n=1 Tax=Marinactinospora rubrisoli TaxID=2715399 RepID=A0ABW2KFJ4_9ACTN
MSTTGNDAETRRRPVRRRARGLARIELILDAAATEFAAAGYERATTNSIAARAGISPGSLYQYFADKEAIAHALASRYAEDVISSQRGAAADDVVSAPLPALVDQIIDPLVEFNVENPAFLALFARPDVPGVLANPIEPIESTFAERLAAILTARNPEVPGGDIALSTQTLILMFRGLMLGVSSLAPDQRALRVRETKAAILGYLRHRELR